MKLDSREIIRIFKAAPERILLVALFIILLILRFLAQNKILLDPINFLFNIYADSLIASSKLLLSFSNADIVFSYVKNQIISQGHLMKIDRFYFSITQIIGVLAVVLLTKSRILNKFLSFIVAFFFLSIYNVLRISLHALYPETSIGHNWFFNLLLIPRWIIVLGFAWYYWRKFPAIFELIKEKFGFTNEFIKKTFLKIAIIIVAYYFVIILTYNDTLLINGSLLISFILNSSKFFINLLGYECWINNRLIYGTNASLYMDDACIGINLMFLFASFIALLPGRRKHKFWFIPMGLMIIVLLNCIRIVLIFINISKTGRYSMFLEIHDLFTYPVLVFTFFMWVVWINDFYLKEKKHTNLPNNY
jgi:exosortase/archaeosortase family protein